MEEVRPFRELQGGAWPSVADQQGVSLPCAPARPQTPAKVGPTGSARARWVRTRCTTGDTVEDRNGGHGTHKGLPGFTHTPWEGPTHIFTHTHAYAVDATPTNSEQGQKEGGLLLP